MTEEKVEKQISLVKAFLTGILLDVLLLAVIYVIRSVRELFIIVLVVAVAHLICSIGLALYRKGQLKKSDLGFIRFGPFYALWQVLM